MKRTTQFALTLTFGAPSVVKSTVDEVLFGEEHTYQRILFKKNYLMTKYICYNIGSFYSFQIILKFYEKYHFNEHGFKSSFFYRYDVIF
jgi:hypothetical protein